MTKRKNNNDVLNILMDLTKKLERKPPLQMMMDEIRMMRFKIKPLAGDISLLQFKNHQLIETLWSLGKLDEMFQKEFKHLTDKDKEVFFRLFDELYQQFQSQLNRLNLKAHPTQTSESIVEMEIFKEISANKRVN